MSTELVVVGGGRMGAAIVGGLLAAGTPPGGVAVVEVSQARRTELVELLPGVTVTDAVPVHAAAVVAVKPPDVADAVSAVVTAGARRVLSVAAGVRLVQLRAAAGDDVELVRCMPNTPALVGAGASAVAGDPGALDWAESLLRPLGDVVRLDETQLDAVTGLSGSGPAYVFLVVEALIEAGVLEGLPREVATRLAVATVAGSGRLLQETGDDPASARAGVTSPGGTTARGLHELEKAGVRAAFVEAVRAAAARSRELG